MRTITLILSIVMLCACNEASKQKKAETNQSQAKITNQTKQENVFFKKILKGDKITYKIECLNNSSMNDLIIEITGDKKIVLKENFEIDGTVSNAEIRDIDNDGKEELFVYTNSVGSGGYGDVFVLTVNSKNKVVKIDFPETALNEKIKEGYMGHDSFHLKEYSLIQIFPIYKVGDSNANSTGGKRRVKYEFRKKDDSINIVYSSHTDTNE